ELLRHVDAYVRQLVGLEELERLVPVLVAQPRLVAELDTDAVRLRPLCAFDEVLLVRPPEREPRRELEQHRTQLPAAIERRERVEEAGPEVLDRVLVEILRVHALLALWSHLLRKRRRLRRMLGEDREGFDVEREAGRGALRPLLHDGLPGRVVVRRVHLDEREL